jgi:hypothetical protein
MAKGYRSIEVGKRPVKGQARAKQGLKKGQRTRGRTLKSDKTLGEIEVGRLFLKVCALIIAKRMEF